MSLDLKDLSDQMMDQTSGLAGAPSPVAGVLNNSMDNNMSQFATGADGGVINHFGDIAAAGALFDAMLHLPQGDSAVQNVGLLPGNTHYGNPDSGAGESYKRQAAALEESRQAAAQAETDRQTAAAAESSMSIFGRSNA